MRGAVRGAVLVSAAILAASAWAILAFVGTGSEAVRGLCMGFLLGAGGCAAELVLMRRALERPLQNALRIVLGGMGIRLVVLLAGTLWLAATGVASPAAFALSFVAGFFAFLPVLAALATGGPRNGEAKS